MVSLERKLDEGFRASEVRDAELAQKIDVNSHGLAALEVTVAQGFHESAARDFALGQRIDSLGDTLNRKIDANTGALSRQIHELTEEVRRSNDSIRLVLIDNSNRLTDLEKK